MIDGRTRTLTTRTGDDITRTGEDRKYRIGVDRTTRIGELITLTLDGDRIILVGLVVIRELV